MSTLCPQQSTVEKERDVLFHHLLSTTIATIPQTLAERRTLIQVSYPEAICCHSSEILAIFICHHLLSYNFCHLGLFFAVLLVGC